MPKPPKSTPHSDLTGVHRDEKTNIETSIESESLRGDIPCDEKLSDRFERIVTGLSRQLRSAITRDQEIGRYALDIAVVDKAER